MTRGGWKILKKKPRRARWIKWLEDWGFVDAFRIES